MLSPLCSPVNNRVPFALKALGLAWAVAGLMFFLALFTGCERRTSGPVASEGSVSRWALPLTGFHSDETYAPVSLSALPGFYDDLKAVLDRQGLTRWDNRYDCTHFASLYVALARARYAAQAWHAPASAPQTLALAEVWYRSASRGNHAIVAALTAGGLVFIEPQTGEILNLTPAEKASAYFVKW